MEQREAEKNFTTEYYHVNSRPDNWTISTSYYLGLDIVFQIWSE